MVRAIRHAGGTVLVGALPHVQDDDPPQMVYPPYATKQ